MPLDIRHNAPTVLVRRAAWERSGLSHADTDPRLNLTPDEFRAEGSVVAIGPLFEDADLEQLVTMLEGAGLMYFEEFFDLSGNWPEWLAVYVQAHAG